MIKEGKELIRVYNKIWLKIIYFQKKMKSLKYMILCSIITTAKTKKYI